MEKSTSLTWLLGLRLAVAASIALLMHVVCYATFAGFLHMNLLQPLSWFYYFIIVVLSPATFYWIPSAIAMLFVGIATLNDITAEPNIMKCRLDELTRFFSLKMSIKILAYSFMSVTVPIAYLYLSEQSFTTVCSYNDKLKCTNTGTIFMASCATFGGIVTILSALKTDDITEGSLINLPAMEFVRPTFRRVLKQSGFKSLQLSLIYGAVYFFLKNYINSLYGIVLLASSGNVNLTFWIFLGSWMLSWVTCASVLNLKELLNLYLTQYTELALPSLIQLLELPISAFEEQLVFKDLSQVACGRSVVPASEVFTLSQPGGMPHNWNAIIRNCLRVIDTFHYQVNECCTPQPLVQQNIKPFQEVKSPSQLSGNLRRLRTSSAPLLIPPSDDMLADVLSPLKSHVEATLSKVSGFVTKPVQYFTASQQDLHVSSVLENTHTVMLAAKILSGLSCRALTDDKCGVIVNDLHVIINTLFTLEESVSRITLPKKKLKSKKASTMHLALPVAVKQAITQIALSYSSHLEFLHLNPARMATLRRLVETGQDKEPISNM